MNIKAYNNIKLRIICNICLDLKEKLKARWPELLLLVVLAKFAFSLAQLVDLDTIDEALYLKGGLNGFGNLWNRFTDTPDWGPLYSLWYYMLSIFSKDPVQIYRISSTTIIILLPIMFFLVLRQWKNGKITSIICSAILVFNPCTTFVTRKPNHLALLIMLTLIFFAGKFRNKSIRAGVIYLAFNVVCFIRPAYLIGALLFYPILLLTVLHGPSKIKIKLIKTTLALSLLAPLLFNISNINNSPKQKSTFVFINKNFERIQLQKKTTRSNTEDIFGHKNTVINACLYNTQECFAHFFFNTKTLLAQQFTTLQKTAIMFYHLSAVPIIFFIAFSLGLIIISPTTIRLLPRPTRHHLKNQRELLIIFIALLAPTLAACVIYGPLHQYQIGYLAIAAAITLPKLARFQIKINKYLKSTFIAVLSCLALIYPQSFNPSESLGQRLEQSFTDRRVSRIIQTIKNIKMNSDIKVVSVDGIYHYYFLPSKEGISLWHEQSHGKHDFNKIIAQRKTNLLIFEKYEFNFFVKNIASQAMLKSMTRFLSSYHKYDFTCVHNSPDFIIMAKKSLLARPPKIGCPNFNNTFLKVP